MAVRGGTLALVVLVCSCGQSDGSCGRLEIDVTSAIAAAPSSWMQCSVDADCTVVGSAATLCVPSCSGPAVASAHVSDLGDFITTDPGVTQACQAYAAASCDVKQPVRHCPATRVSCVANVCVLQ